MQSNIWRRRRLFSKNDGDCDHPKQAKRYIVDKMEVIRENSSHREEIHPLITDIPRNEVIRRKMVIIIAITIILTPIIPIITIELFDVVVLLKCALTLF